MKTIRQIAKEKLYEEELQLMVLMTSNPLLLNGSKIKKFPVIETRTDEGVVFQENILIVPLNYESDKTFESEEEEYPCASLKILIRLDKDTEIT